VVSQKSSNFPCMESITFSSHLYKLEIKDRLWGYQISILHADYYFSPPYLLNTPLISYDFGKKEMKSTNCETSQIMPKAISWIVTPCGRHLCRRENLRSRNFIRSSLPHLSFIHRVHSIYSLLFCNVCLRSLTFLTSARTVKLKAGVRIFYGAIQ
jgi:hypothetical protein